MENETKQRVAIWLYPSMLEQINQLLSTAESRNCSEFISKAVIFYAGYLATKSSEGYISDTLLATMNERLSKAEMRLCKTIFKLAVELSITMNIVASITEVDQQTLDELRKSCISRVKKSYGTVRFDNAYDYQHGIISNCLEEEDLL